MMTEAEQRMLAEIKAGLNPPTKEELDAVTARWLFGERANVLMRYAPWSFVLTKIMWKEGESPWES